MGVCKKALKPMFKNDKWHILRGDTVKMLCGKDKDEVGTVLRVIRDEKIPRVVVSGLNLVKRHVRQEKGSNAPGIITKEAPIHYSNVALLDPVTKGAVRVQWRFLEDGSKVRVGKGRQASGSIIPRPEILRSKGKPPLPGAKDTPRSIASELTYDPEEMPDLWIGKSNKRAYSTASMNAVHFGTFCTKSAALTLPCSRQSLSRNVHGFSARLFVS